jgi:HlyD family secretion protein
MVQSVVTYTVVVDVDNSGGKLLPYLTARLRFEVENRQGVLIVPNVALRWQPRPQDIHPEVVDASARARRPQTSGAGGTLWIRRGDFVRPVNVEVGLNDGTQTEVSGEGLREGTEVVIGATRPVEADDVSAILPYTNTDK